MKFEPNEIVVYQDDGLFPSLDGQECRVINLDKRHGYKLLTVEFILYTGTKFEYSFSVKQFKKLRKLTRSKEQPKR